MALRLVVWLLLATVSPRMIAVAPGEDVAVLDSGSRGDPAVVLVPGLSGCAYGFRNLIPLLHAQGLRTVAVEPLGIGLSSRTSDADYTLAAQAGRLAAVLDSLDVHGAVAVSQGVATGMVLRLVLARPDLVAGVVSIEGGAAESAATDAVRNRLTLAKIMARMGGVRFLRDRYENDLRQASGDDAWVDKRVVRHYFRGAGRDIQGTLDAYLAMVGKDEPRPLIPRLPGIPVPVILLLGGAEHGSSLPPDQIDILAEGLPDLEVRTVPGAGHFIHEEQPAAVAGAVDDLRERLAASQR